MRAADTRKTLERKARNAGRGKRLDRRLIERIEQPDEECTALQLWQFCGGGAAHGKDDVGGKRFGGAADARAGGLEIRVWNARVYSSASLDDDLMLAARGQLLDGFWRRSDTGLPGAGLAWNADDHCDGSLRQARSLAAILPQKPFELRVTK